jgi:predicted MFS family arabinose efflux permease
MDIRSSILWRQKDFLKFWIGETVSLFGSQITHLALPLTAVVLLNATPMQMGILTAAGTAPYLFLTLFAGVWVDRHRRRPILVIANFGRALLLLLIPLLAWFEILRIEHVIGVAFLVGVLTVFFEVTYQSFLPRLLDRNQLADGNSKLSMSTATSEIGGPGFAALLVQVFSAPFALVVDACSFLVSAFSLLMIRKEEPEPAPSTHEPVLAAIREGWRFMIGNRYLSAIAGEAATYNLFWNVIQAIFMLYMVRELGMNAGSISLIFIVGSVGGLLGALVTNRMANHLGVGATVVGAAVISDLVTIALPFVAQTSINVVVVLALIFFIRGFGMTAVNVHTYSLRQSIIPDQLLGRTNAAYRLLTYGAMPLGALLGGFLSERFGLQPTLLVGAVGLLSTWLWLWFSPVRQLRRIPAARIYEPPLEPPGAPLERMA